MKKINKEKIKTWFVTGASSGVGHELCKQLLDRDYNVVAVSRRIPDFKHKNAFCLSCDVTDPESVKEAINKGIEHFKKIDVVSNNAGISTSVIFEEETLEHMKKVMDVNFFGIYNVMHAIIPHFRKNHNGTIINNTSMHGLSPRKYGSAYCSSKHAIEGLTSVVHLETKNFCRVITFELGWFRNTNIGKGGVTGSKRTYIKEYENVTSYYVPIKYDFDNILPEAINSIINEAEKETPRRRLILGRDALTKVDYEIKSMQENLKYSKENFISCSPKRKTQNKKIEYYQNYLKYLKYKILKNFVGGKTKQRYKEKQKILHEKIRAARKLMKG